MKPRRNRVKLFVVLLTPLMLFNVDFVCAQAVTRRPVPKDDTQEWNDVQITVPLNKTVDFILLGTLRIGRNITHPVDERIGFNFSYKVNKYFTLIPGYLHINMRPTSGQQSHEERLSIAGTLTLPKKRFTLTDRNTLERRFRSPQLDATRYRNRLQLEYPFKLQGTQLTFVTSDEVFYDGSLHDWVRNRFLIGVRKTFNKRFATDLYYLRQNDGRSRPGDLNVIGTIFRIRP
jgi:hypothetical protein